MASMNPMTEPPVNMSISAYRVLFILLMLVRYRSLNMMELNRLLSENPVIGRGYNSETLTKYINTLREVGCRIPRATSRNDYSYELLKNPFPLMLNPEEVEVAAKLLAVLAMQPDEVLYQDYRTFLSQLFWSVDGIWQEPKLEPGLQVFPNLVRRREQLNTYRRYCQESFTLELTYRDQDEESNLLLEPYELIEREQRLLLVGMDCNTQQQRILDIDQIVFVKQLPSKNRRPISHMTVTFALYGRLSNSYRLYPGEKVVYRSEQEVHIKTKVSDTSGLMCRLLKYGPACQLLSPDSLREAMRLHISGLLDVLLSSVLDSESL